VPTSRAKRRKLKGYKQINWILNIKRKLSNNSMDDKSINKTKTVDIFVILIINKKHSSFN
jgi:hypothetical protein